MRCGDAEWLATLRRTFDTLVAEAGPAAADVRFSISEQYDDAPSDLVDATGVLGWTCRIGDGAAAFATTPSTDVDVMIRLTYELFDELARIVVAGDAERRAAMDQRAAEAIAGGSMHVQGRLDGAPPWLATLHDRMAEAVRDPAPAADGA